MIVCSWEKPWSRMGLFYPLNLVLLDLYVWHFIIMRINILANPLHKLWIYIVFFNISTEIRPMHTVSSINKSVTLFHDLRLLLSRIEKKNQEILPCFILLIIRFLIMIELVSNRVWYLSLLNLLSSLHCLGIFVL